MTPARGRGSDVPLDVAELDEAWREADGRPWSLLPVDDTGTVLPDREVQLARLVRSAR